jgi:hypothetical protein
MHVTVQHITAFMSTDYAGSLAQLMTHSTVRICNSVFASPAGRPLIEYKVKVLVDQDSHALFTDHTTTSAN